MWVQCLLSVGRKNLPVEADVQNLLLLKQSALNYKANLPNINLVGNEFELTKNINFQEITFNGGR
jgi:hypothetical protein